jgi:cyanophycinase-like exopeptidase
MGGGLDVKPALGRMITRMAECANGTAGRLGNFVVVRAGGNPSYDSYIYKLGPLASVVTIVVPTIESANDPALEPYIRNAGAIFLTGGDQGDYYNFWKGTLLERVISEQVKTYGVPIGGTSAGMMILSHFNYIAYPYTIYSFEALANPFKEGAVTLKNDFWTNKTPFLPLMNTVTDSHFDTRDRMGRLVTFLARTIGDGWAKKDEARAIGVDQETALLMEYPNATNTGTITVKMELMANPDVSGAAYLLNATAASKLVVTPGQPLTFTNVAVQKIPVNAAATNYTINVNGGTMSSTSGSLY